MNLLLIVLSNLVFLIVSYFYLAQYPQYVLAGGGLILGIVALLAQRYLTQRQRLIKTLEHGFLSFNDGDFSISLAIDPGCDHQQLFELFNQTGEKLRLERQHLYQREMLLDKVLSASPVATILVDQREKVVFCNQAAQQVFDARNSMLGAHWPNLTSKLAQEFQQALAARGESIFTLSDNEGQQQAWHVAISSVRVHQAQHQLYLLKTITAELSKQEVATWKKVISVLSHELNNSIAPISSMCHSGNLLADKLDEPRLNRVFKSISGRINHLNEFIKGYASLTRIKQPLKAPVDWSVMIDQLTSLYPFDVIGLLPTLPVYADCAQLEQVLINIIKNADESSGNSPITMAFKQSKISTEIEICDSGSGMSKEVIANALLPFYSTKHSGTGLGLALCREIIEAHHGRLSFINRDGGGLSVTVLIPNQYHSE